MRIGLIYHQFKSEAGGLEKYLSGLAQHLSADGHELSLIGSVFDDGFTAIKGAENLPILCRGSKTRRLREFAQRAAEIAKESKLDVTLGFGRTYFQDLHRAGGGCHKVYSRFLPAHKRIRRKNRLELELEERLYTGGETRHFVVNAALVGDQICEEYGVSRDRITVIHTPVDTRGFTPSHDPAAAKQLVCGSIGSDPERAAFLFVSLNHRRKGLSSLLNVWDNIDADLWIAGTPLRSEHKRQIQRRGIGDRVRFLGRSRDLVPYYQAADGFLHPTLYDACANTVLQSMACGLPGLISARDGASEFIRDGENGYLLEDPTNPHQIRGGIQNLLELTSEQRLVMATAARETVIPLTWESHLANWHAAIKRTLQS